MAAQAHARALDNEQTLCRSRIPTLPVTRAMVGRRQRNVLLSAESTISAAHAIMCHHISLCCIMTAIMNYILSGAQRVRGGKWLSAPCVDNAGSAHANMAHIIHLCCSMFTIMYGIRLTMSCCGSGAAKCSAPCQENTIVRSCDWEVSCMHYVV